MNDSIYPIRKVFYLRNENDKAVFDYLMEAFETSKQFPSSRQDTISERVRWSLNAAAFDHWRNFAENLAKMADLAKDTAMGRSDLNTDLPEPIVEVLSERTNMRFYNANHKGVWLESKMFVIAKGLPTSGRLRLKVGWLKVYGQGQEEGEALVEAGAYHLCSDEHGSLYITAV